MIYVKGQGATEYLVLLGVVLIVALVAIALLGFFPGLSSDAKETQSRAYWAGTASPFQITDFRYSGTDLTLVVRNSRTESLEIANVTLTPGPGGTPVVWTPSSSGSVGSGNTVTLEIDNAPSCSSGDSFEMYVSFLYNTNDITGNTQRGEKALVGKCA
ncbi:hypothetical protein KO465_01910 [Candidatus Micrarchaeota archaeon]|nr:hypothetical protein [Candidatus Micrarchaeota archaeon]